jgi:hypothetical protein
MDLTPAVFALPLSLVTTPVFDGTFLLFAFCGMLAFVSTTPSRCAAGALAFALVLLALSVAEQPVKAAPTMNTNASA